MWPNRAPITSHADWCHLISEKALCLIQILAGKKSSRWGALSTSLNQWWCPSIKPLTSITTMGLFSKAKHHLLCLSCFFNFWWFDPPRPISLELGKYCHFFPYKCLMGNTFDLRWSIIWSLRIFFSWYQLSVTIRFFFFENCNFQVISFFYWKKDFVHFK